MFLQKENQVAAVSTQHEPATLVSVEPRAYAARAALCSSLKCSSNDRGVQQLMKVQELVGLDSSFPDKEKNVTPVSTITACGRETCRVDRYGQDQTSAENETFLLGHGENKKQSTLPHGLNEKKQPKAHFDLPLNKKQSEETSKEHITPKSILLTSQSKEWKVNGETNVCSFSVEGVCRRMQGRVGRILLTLSRLLVEL